MDEAIPQSFRSWILCLLGVLGTLFVICLATPFFTILIVPLAVVYYFVQVSWPKWHQKQYCLGKSEKKKKRFISGAKKTTENVLFVLHGYSHQTLLLFSVCTALLCGDFETAASSRLSVTLSYILTLQRDGVRSVGDKSLRPSRQVSEAQRNNYWWKPEERLPMDCVKQVRYWFQVLLQNRHHHQIQTNIFLKRCGSQCVSVWHTYICVHVVCVFVPSADGSPSAWSFSGTWWCFSLLCLPSFQETLWTVAWLACPYPTLLMSVMHLLSQHTHCRYCLCHKLIRAIVMVILVAIISSKKKSVFLGLCRSHRPSTGWWGWRLSWRPISLPWREWVNTASLRTRYVEQRQAKQLYQSPWIE